MPRGRSKTSQMTAIEREKKLLEEEEKRIRSEVRRAMEEVANAPMRHEQKRQAQLAKRHRVTIPTGRRSGGRGSRTLNAVAMGSPKSGVHLPGRRRDRRYALIRFLCLLVILAGLLILLLRSIPS